jgi:2-haloacid dehalogenase
MPMMMIVTTQPAARIDAVVFDVGGVLLDWDPRHLYRKLFDDEQEMERFLAGICTPEWHALADLGTPAAQGCAELAARYPEHQELIWAWAHRSEEMIAGEIDASIGILRELNNQGTPCFALTNMEAETYPIRSRRFDFFALFDGIVVSGLERIAKPDPAIFERLLQRFGLTPRTTLMIDDSPANVAAARAAGMQAIEFTSATQLRRSLEQLGVL